MVTGQQPIIFGRGLSTHWQQTAPRLGTKLRAVVVEMEGQRGILDIEGYLMRIETQLPLQEGDAVRLLYMGRERGQIHLQLLTGDPALPTGEQEAGPTAIPERLLSQTQAITQGLVAFKLPVTENHIAALQKLLPNPEHQDFYPRLAAAISLMQSRLPVTRAAVEAVLAAHQRHLPTTQPDALPLAVPTLERNVGGAGGQPAANGSMAPPTGLAAGATAPPDATGRDGKPVQGDTPVSLPSTGSSDRAERTGLQQAEHSRMPQPFPRVVAGGTFAGPQPSQLYRHHAAAVRPLEAEAARFWHEQPAVPPVFAGVSQMLVEPAALRFTPLLAALFTGPWDTPVWTLEFQSGSGVRPTPEQSTAIGPAPSREGAETSAKQAFGSHGTAQPNMPGEGGVPRNRLDTGMSAQSGVVAKPDSRITWSGRLLRSQLHFFIDSGGQRGQGPAASSTHTPASSPPQAVVSQPAIGQDESFPTRGLESTQTVQQQRPLTEESLTASLTSLLLQPAAGGPGLQSLLMSAEHPSIFQLLAEFGEQQESLPQPSTEAASVAQAAARLLQWTGEEKLHMLLQQRSGADGILEIALPVQWQNAAETVHIRWKTMKSHWRSAQETASSKTTVQILAGLHDAWLFVEASLQLPSLDLEFASDNAQTLRDLERNRSLLETALRQHQLRVNHWETKAEAALERWHAGAREQNPVQLIRQTPVPSLDLKI